LQNRVFAKNVAALTVTLDIQGLQRLFILFEAGLRPPSSSHLQNNKPHVLFQPFEKLGRNKKFISFLSWFKAAALKHTCKQEVRNKAKGFTQKLKI
jgi:hypothetical protein